MLYCSVYRIAHTDISIDGDVYHGVVVYRGGDYPMRKKTTEKGTRENRYPQCVLVIYAASRTQAGSCLPSEQGAKITILINIGESARALCHERALTSDRAFA